MSSIMSSFKLQNQPHRNGFDLSNRHAFSAKIGELLPVQVRECLPGDKFKINLSHFSRTQPLTSPAYVRIREYYDFCFVPYRLLWRYYDQFINQMPNNVSSSSIDSEALNFNQHPFFTSGDIISYLNELNNYDTLDEMYFQKVYTSQKLLQYLGYGRLPIDEDSYSLLRNYAFNPFPLLAYQKIYNDIYRFDQWEQPMPHCFNVDYLNDPSNLKLDVLSLRPVSQSDSIDMFNMRYANYAKDLIMGVLPNSQFGDVAIVSTAPNAEELGIGDSYLYVTKDGEQIDMSSPDNINSVFRFNILALRRAEFLQKWKEVTQTAKQDYRDQIKAHWNVNVSKARSGVVEYLGGITSNVQIDGEVNANLSDGSTIIKGTAISGARGTIEYDVPEHGIIMCIYHSAPLLDYNANFAVSRLAFKTFNTDYAIPELDQTGMEQVPVEVLDDSFNINTLFSNSGNFFGYAPRYVDYKTDIDRAYGIFVSDSEFKNWVAPFSSSNLIPPLSGLGVGQYRMFKVNPRCFNDVFEVNVNSSVVTDQLLCNADFDIKAVRNLDVNGMPY